MVFSLTWRNKILVVFLLIIAYIFGGLVFFSLQFDFLAVVLILIYVTSLLVFFLMIIMLLGGRSFIEFCSYFEVLLGSFFLLQIVLFVILVNFFFDVMLFRIFYEDFFSLNFFINYSNFFLRDFYEVRCNYLGNEFKLSDLLNLSSDNNHDEFFVNINTQFSLDGFLLQNNFDLENNLFSNISFSFYINFFSVFMGLAFILLISLVAVVVISKLGGDDDDFVDIKKIFFGISFNKRRGFIPGNWFFSESSLNFLIKNVF